MPMTDNLRDRIAAVIHNRFESNEEPCCGCHDLADRVIRALADDVRRNGIWGVIDLLIELAGPRCFAQLEPPLTHLAKPLPGHQIVAAKTRSNGESSLICQCGWESEWSKSDSKIHTDHSLHLIESR